MNDHPRKVASALEDLGVRKSDRVAVLIPNQPEFVEVLVGCSVLGAIFVPINTRLAEDEIAYILEDSNPEAFIWDSSLESKAKEAHRRVMNHRCSMTPIQIGGDSSDGTQLYEDWRESYEAYSGHSDIWEHDAALMMYTSGTTGRPKGAMITHSNVMWNALNISVDFGGGMDDVILHTAPLFHITPLSILLFGLYFGGSSVLQKSFHPVNALEAIQEHRVTFAFMVPAMWQAVTQVPNLAEYDLSSLRLCPSGGAPCPQPVIEFFLNLWGETVAAIVVPKAGRHIQWEDVRSFCDSSLARYKMPTRLHIVDALPRNGVGKVAKVELRHQFGNQSVPL